MIAIVLEPTIGGQIREITSGIRPQWPRTRHTYHQTPADGRRLGGEFEGGVREMPLKAGMLMIARKNRSSERNKVKQRSFGLSCAIDSSAHILWRHHIFPLNACTPLLSLCFSSAYRFSPFYPRVYFVLQCYLVLVWPTLGSWGDTKPRSYRHWWGGNVRETSRFYSPFHKVRAGFVGLLRGQTSLLVSITLRSCHDLLSTSSWHLN